MQRISLLVSMLIVLAVCDSAGAYYHAQLGRFVTRDPIEYAAGDMNLYRYVGGMPTSFTDPSGLVEWPKVKPDPPGLIAPWPGSPIWGNQYAVPTDDGKKLVPCWRDRLGTVYWCHGYTFGGSDAEGGPFSFFGDAVPDVLEGDGWNRIHCCMAGKGDILVFYDDDGIVTHSGIVEANCAPSGCVNEGKASFISKWGNGALRPTSWEEAAKTYGRYECYRKGPPVHGVCSCSAANERPYNTK